MKKTIINSSNFSKIRIKAIDFFCGSGGLTRGLINSGIDVLAGIDNDLSAQQTYEKNNKVPFIHADIRELSYEELEKYIGKRIYPLLFAGCAPCQPFSLVNRRNREDRASDKLLLLEFAKFIEYFKPEYLISENVPQMRESNEFNEFIEVLNRNNYNLEYKLLDAQYYAVPQRRKRLVLLASRLSTIDLPQPLKIIKTVKDAINHFPSLKAGECSSNVANHIAPNLTEINLLRIQATKKNGGSWDCWPEELKLECHKKLSGYKDVYGRMSWDRPSPTLTTRCNNYSSGRFGHPSQNRAISLREAAAIQTFPDDYIFFGNQGIIAKHIGNAVPPLLAEALGKQVIKSVNNTPGCKLKR
jgi:DNA (cytosine-5)-methyltransferase 1